MFNQNRLIHKKKMRNTSHETPYPRWTPYPRNFRRLIHAKLNNGMTSKAIIKALIEFWGWSCFLPFYRIGSRLGLDQNLNLCKICNWVTCFKVAVKFLTLKYLNTQIKLLIEKTGVGHDDEIFIKLPSWDQKFDIFCVSEFWLGTAGEAAKSGSFGFCNLLDFSESCQNGLKIDDFQWTRWTNTLQPFKCAIFNWKKVSSGIILFFNLSKGHITHVIASSATHYSDMTWKWPEITRSNQF